MIKLGELKLETYVSNLCVGDINNDYLDELVIIGEDGTLLIYSIYTEEMKLLYQDQINFSIDYCRIVSTEKNHPLLLLAGHDRCLRIYEFKEDKLWLKVQKEYDGRINYITIGDIYYDNEPELIICSDRYITISSVNQNSIQNLAKTRFNGEVYSVKVTKFKNEPHNSIIFGCRDNKLHVIQYQNSFFLKKHLEISTGYYVLHCHIGDLTNDKQLEIVTIGADNTLRIFHYEEDHLEEIESLGFKYPIRFLSLCDIDGDGIVEIVVFINNLLEIYKFNDFELKKVNHERFPDDIKKIIYSTLDNRTIPYFIFSNYHKEVFIYTLTD